MAGLLNSADLSRSCISSCCSNSKNMINNYFTIFFVKNVNFFKQLLKLYRHFFGPQATICTKTPRNSNTKTAKTTSLFYRKENKIVKSCSTNWSIKRWIVEMVLRSCWCLNWLQSANSFQENIFLVDLLGYFKILMGKIQCVLSHYFISFHDTIYTSTITCACTLFNEIFLPLYINNDNKKITPWGKVA